MARPKKIGLDYFPLDTSIDLDDKIQLIEAEFGIKGFAIIIKLLCKIYADKGYYYSWTEVERLLFAKRTGETVGLVDNIVKRSVKWGLFNESLFNQFQILTSEAIQLRFIDAIKRRETVEIIEEYVLFNVNDYNNEVNVNINIINVNINPQSKVEKSKVKESKEENFHSKNEPIKNQKENPPPGSAPPPPKFTFQNFWDAYGKKVDKTKCERKWSRLKESEKKQAMCALPEYVSSTPDIQFRKNPATWLNGKCWNDEIIKPRTNERNSGSYQRNGFTTKNGGFKLAYASLEEDLRADGKSITDEA